MNNKTKLNRLNAMVCPILLNYLLMSIFELLDKAIVGHYSVRGFAVIGMAAAPIFEITGALGILSAAFSILAARQKGRGESDAFEQTFTVSRFLAGLIGGGFFLLSLLGGRPFFRIVYAQTGENLEKLLGYFYPASFTVLQNMLIFLYSAYFRNRFNTKISFYSTAVSTAVNLFFDLSLVHGLFGLPRLGPAGAAWGSVIGLEAGLLVYRIPCFCRRPRLIVGAGAGKEILRSLLSLYPSLLGQEFLESTLFVLVVSGVAARLGTEQMAVYSLLGTLSGALGLPIYAYSAAAQTCACQAHAAGDLSSARAWLRLGRLPALAAVCILWLMCLIGRKTVLGWIVSDPAVIARAGSLLGWVLAFLLAKTFYQFYMGYLQGTGREKFVFTCAAAATAAASLAAVALGPALGLAGLYLVMTVEFIILSVIYIQKTAADSAPSH